MRKLFFLVLAFSAGVLTLAWINSRPERRSGRRGSTSHRTSGTGGSPAGARADTPPARPAPAAPAAGPRRCAATTASGNRCSREAEEGSRFCWQHG